MANLRQWRGFSQNGLWGSFQWALAELCERNKICQVKIPCRVYKMCESHFPTMNNTEATQHKRDCFSKWKKVPFSITFSRNEPLVDSQFGIFLWFLPAPQYSGVKKIQQNVFLSYKDLNDKSFHYNNSWPLNQRNFSHTTCWWCKPKYKGHSLEVKWGSWIYFSNPDCVTNKILFASVVLRLNWDSHRQLSQNHVISK